MIAIDPPDVVVEVRASLDGQIWVLQTPECPYCGKAHEHGGGLIADGPPALGFRLSHCVTKRPARPYRLVIKRNPRDCD